jgi:hypothetical protein
MGGAGALVVCDSVWAKQLGRPRVGWLGAINAIHDQHVDKEINHIKEIFYEGLYIRNYEHQNFLDISIRNAISTIIFPDYADMMNRFVDMVLVRDHYKVDNNINH